MKKIAASLFLLTILASCQSTNQARQDNLKKIWGEYFSDGFNETKAMDILVATNRNTNSNFGCSDENFGINNGTQLNFGVCKVNVPKNHDVGEINFTSDNRQSSNDYFKILSAKAFDENELIKTLKLTNRPALIFVHGFNVRYQDAVLRAAQIAYDLKYQGPVILFSWPAGARDKLFEQRLISKTYSRNLDNAGQSVEFFKNFLLKLYKNNIEINLIVHSMGHQIVLPALAQINQQNANEIFINNLVLNAPDFEVSQFKNLTKNLKQISHNTTLYCSYNDKAIFVSQTFNNSDRLGACAFSEDFDTINVGLVDDDSLGLGHSYYSSRPILTDIFQNFLGIPVEKRLFIIKSEPNSTQKYFLRK